MARKTINKSKRPGRKIFANHVTDKGLISKIYKKFTQNQIKKKKRKVKIWEEDLSRYFSNENVDSQKAHENMFNTANY